MAAALEIDPVYSRLSEIYHGYSKFDLDFVDSETVSWASSLTIEVADNHNLLMIRPTGSGETEYSARTSSDELT
jgi:hypothetical protein